MRWSVTLRQFFGIAVLAAIGILFIHTAGAVEWAEPTGIPPTANPPGFVWTRSPADPAQVGGQFNIVGAGRVGGLLEALGGAVFGGATLDLGADAGGQNVLFGSAKYSGMHANDALILLQTASDAIPPVLTNRLRVNRNGDLVTTGDVLGGRLCIGVAPAVACRDSWTTGVRLQEATPGATETGNLNISGTALVGDLTASGDITALGCFGPVLRARSVASYQGNAGAPEGAGGYIIANGRCPVGQHVCTTTEVLNSINCGAFATAGVASDTDMWIANLAPSLPTPTNDCVGWTTASPDWWGIKWRLNTTTGGGAFAERCGTSLPFACCS
ncbi:hypothetical protein HY634_02725 [Candidatus Uhrbacteria bacterium]|nr:hypothetical protein [Candidatus Uhrbacteria bacterium]